MVKKLLSTILILSVAALSFTACDSKKEPEVSVSIGFYEGPLITSSEASVISASETSVSESTETSVSVSEPVTSEPVSVEERETIAFYLLIANQCQADIAMVSTINPYTEEQVQVGELPDGKILKMDFSDWPKDVTTLDLAFYNGAGKLVSSTAVDITGVNEQVTVFLTGEGTIENVKGAVK